MSIWHLWLLRVICLVVPYHWCPGTEIPGTWSLQNYFPYWFCIQHSDLWGLPHWICFLNTGKEKNRLLIRSRMVDLCYKESVFKHYASCLAIFRCTHSMLCMAEGEVFSFWCSIKYSPEPGVQDTDAEDLKGQEVTPEWETPFRCEGLYTNVLLILRYLSDPKIFLLCSLCRRHRLWCLRISLMLQKGLPVGFQASLKPSNAKARKILKSFPFPHPFRELKGMLPRVCRDNRVLQDLFRFRALYDGLWDPLWYLLNQIS